MAYFDSLYGKSSNSAPTPTISSSSGGGGYFGSLFSSKPTQTKTTTTRTKKLQNILAPIDLVQKIKHDATNAKFSKSPDNLFNSIGNVASNVVNAPIGGGASLADTYNQAMRDLSHGFANKAGEDTPNAPAYQQKSALESKSKAITTINKAIPRFQDDVVTVITSALQGATGGIFKTPVRDLNPETHILKPIGELAGQTVALEKLGGVVNKVINKVPLVKAVEGTKLAFIPKVLSSVATFDIYGQLDPQTKNRIKHLLNDSEQGVLLSVIGGIGKAKVSVPLAFGSGVGLAKLNGADNKDALTSGVLFAALEMGNKIPGLVSNKPKPEYTPQEARNYVLSNKLENTPKGNKIIMDSFDAQAQGKNLEIQNNKSKLIEPGATYEKKIVYSGQPIGKDKESKVTFYTEDKSLANKYADLNKKVTGKSEVIQKDISGLNFKEVPQNQMLDAIENSQIKSNFDGVKFKDANTGTTSYVVFNKPKLNNETQISASTLEGKTPSKIAVSIERKAIEQGLTKGFENIAGYDKITIKDQAAKAESLMSNLDQARKVIRGEEPLPTGLRGTSLVVAAEQYIKKTGDAQMAYDLANSPLVSGTSAAAQELAMAAQREPDSLALKLQDLKKAREATLQKRTGKTVDKAVKLEVDKIKTEIVKKAPNKYDWGEFIKTIQC